MIDDFAVFAGHLPAMRAVAGLDLGDKTIGVAVSDVMTRVASPLQTIRRRKFTQDAEELLALLRKALGSLPVIPVSFATPLEQQMTDWLKAGSAPAPFEIQDEAELKAVADEGGIVRFKQQDLQEDEVLAHLETGKQVHKLALHFGQSVAFLLGSDVTLKRLKFSEEFRAGNDELGNDDPMARLDADFAMMSSELVALLESSINALGGLEPTE